MEIEGHRLVRPPEGIDLSWAGVKHGGLLEAPKIIVVHYGVTDSLDALVAAQQHQGYSAHLSIDGWYRGDRESVSKVVQHVPFDRVAWHAGQSSWEGLEGCNDFAIGIEISNPGPIVDGKTVYGKAWPESETIRADHKSGLVPHWKHWATYSDQELDLCAHLCALLCQVYPSILDVVGHDDVAPGRKFDPGPAFPLEWLRDTVFPNRQRGEP